MLTVLELYTRAGLTAKSKGSGGTRGEELCGPCPGCGGRDRFCIWPEQSETGTYYCRQCEAAGDAIQFLRDFEGQSFAEAVKTVGKEMAYAPRRRSFSAQPRGIHAGEVKSPQSARWQEKAGNFLAYCETQFWRRPEELAFLASRGIPQEAAELYRIGFNPGERNQNCMIRPRTVWDLPPAPPVEAGGKMRDTLWLPRGIVIPCLESFGMDNAPVQRLRIRRPETDRKPPFDQKYYVVPGSGMRPLFLPQKNGTLPLNACTVVVETELDAIMLHYHFGDIANMLALGTAKTRTLPADIFQAVQSSDTILVALDHDANNAGGKGWLVWQETFPHARRHICPNGKDPGQMAEKDPSLKSVLLWLLSGLPKSFALMAIQKKTSFLAEVANVTVTAKISPASPPPAAEKNKPPDPVKEKMQNLIADMSKRFQATCREVPPFDIRDDDVCRIWRQVYPLNTHYAGDFEFLHILQAHGLLVHPRDTPEGADYFITGHEHWKGEAQIDLLHFSKRYSKKIIEQLYKERP